MSLYTGHDGRYAIADSLAEFLGGSIADKYFNLWAPDECIAVIEKWARWTHSLSEWLDDYTPQVAATSSTSAASNPNPGTEETPTGSNDTWDYKILTDGTIALTNYKGVQTRGQ